MRPLSIALLTWEYPPAASGLPRAAREVAQSLAGAGQDVRVLTLDRDGRERDGDVEVIGRRIRPGSLAGWLRRRAAVGHLVGPHALRAMVVDEHHRRPFDLAEASNWFAPGVLVATSGPVPLVTRNSTPAQIGKRARAGARDRADGAFLDRLERRSAAGSAALISNTAAHRERIEGFYELGGRVPHAAIAPPVDPDVLAAGAAAHYPEDDARIGLLFIGRPDHRKGFDAIVDALVELAADRSAPSFVLRLVGTSEDGSAGARCAPVRPAHWSNRSAGCRTPRCGPSSNARTPCWHRRAPNRSATSTRRRSRSVGPSWPAPRTPRHASSSASPARACSRRPAAGRTWRPPSGASRTEPALRAELRRRALGAAGRCTRERCAAETLEVYRAVLAARANADAALRR